MHFLTFVFKRHGRFLIKSFCVFNATLAIYRYYAYCQVMKERRHMSLITFSFIFKYNSPVSFTNLLVLSH